MELGPLPPIRSSAAMPELPADFQLSAVPAVNAAANSGNGARYGGDRRKNGAAAPAASAEDELTLAGETETISETTTELPADTPQHSINLFA